jgi:hypothetical protein
MVADVQRGSGGDHRRHDLGVAVPQVEGPPVQVQVDQLSAVEIPQPVALAAADHELGAERLPDIDSMGGDVAAGQLEHALFLGAGGVRRDGRGHSYHASGASFTRSR